MSIQDDLEQKDLVPRHGPTRRRRKRPDVIADKVRDQIVTADLRVGDRIPADWVLPETLNASRGTVREALKILEIEGLIITKTGPGGGLFVSAIDPEDAIRFLDNLFLSEPPSIPDIYSLRRQLEPELAAGLAGNSRMRNSATCNRSSIFMRMNPHQLRKNIASGWRNWISIPVLPP